jgi:hypothetical protein
MRFRWTDKEVKDATDEFILKTLCTERRTTLASQSKNPQHSTLYKRLGEIEEKLDSRRYILVQNQTKYGG